jgi:DNA/RNA endonuclease YhcR with UshA esterase domain
MRKILSALLVLLIFSFGSIAAAAIKPEEARQHIGEQQTVCGTVASTHYARSSRGQPTFLNLDRPYPNQIFTILIWGGNRPKFKNAPEEHYAGKRICVTGVITSYRRTPEIIVNNPAQIEE